VLMLLSVLLVMSGLLILKVKFNTEKVLLLLHSIEISLVLVGEIITQPLFLLKKLLAVETHKFG